MKKKLHLVLLLLLFVGVSYGQYSLKGIVRGEDGSVLPSASVVITGSGRVLSSNEQGQFEIANWSEPKISLLVSFIGYKAKSVDVDLTAYQSITVSLAEDENLQEEVIIAGSRVSDKDPIAFTTVKLENLKPLNGAVDVPSLLSLTPSVVTTSDAGNGVGYTSFRVRGTDPSRINAMVDGIPINDAESQGVWWVNMPDIASSASELQFQRGVGSSTQGAGAFGASVNIQSEGNSGEAYTQLSTAYGTYNTSKINLKAGTGLINNHFAFDFRISKIGSDGYIDRASSDLKSFYTSGTYFADKTTLKVKFFTGSEKTYQSWWGIPTVRLNSDAVGMKRYYEHGLYSYTQYQQMLSSDPLTYNYYTYDNQTDNYGQTHLHLVLNQIITPDLIFKIAGHYTKGAGYYENRNDSTSLAKYGIIVTDPAQDVANVINQKWLDNAFYGSVFSLNYTSESTDLVIGGGINNYEGDHFGKMIATEGTFPVAKDHEWYRGTGEKMDVNGYAKANVRIAEFLSLYGDLQFRHISYTIGGTDDKMRQVDQSHYFNFYNPKVGAFATLNKNVSAYLSFSVANREPTRSNFVDANPQYGAPKSERLYDTEFGVDLKFGAFKAGLYTYYMKYNDQLVLTGAVNDVGSAIMVNVDKSYRLGEEITLGYESKWVDVTCNATLSKNKINSFEEKVDNWDTWGQESIEYKNSDISFSPNLIANGIVSIKPLSGLKLNLISQYVDRQYLDNTQSKERSLDGYFTENLSVNYEFHPKIVKSIELNLFVNNIFSENYQSNGWVYSYLLGGKRYAMDGLFQQAPVNALVSAVISF